MCAVLNNAPAVRDRVYSEITNQARARGLGQPQQSEVASAPQAVTNPLTIEPASASTPTRQRRSKLRVVSGLSVPTDASSINVPT
jgi:hypothetical protein